MAAPTYLTPSYITYGMISTQLTQVIDVSPTDPPPNNDGMSEAQVNDFMARAEAFIITSFLENYVLIPLTTNDGGTWDTLLDNPTWAPTYAAIKSLFCAASFYQIYLNYFSTGGEGNNGKELIRDQVAQINYYSNVLLRLDQAGNPLLKNCFIGLKLSPNASPRIAKAARVPCGIPYGTDQSWAAFNATPNARWGFDR